MLSVQSKISRPFALAKDIKFQQFKLILKAVKYRQSVSRFLRQIIYISLDFFVYNKNFRDFYNNYPFFNYAKVVRVHQKRSFLFFCVLFCLRKIGRAHV